MSGNIVIKPLTAKLTRNTEFFGKMDPLVKVLVGTHYQRTGVARKGHKNPGWETELTLRRQNEDIIHFELWDGDIMKGDLIGSGDLSFNKIFQMGNRVSGWIPLFYKGKDAGDLLVDVLFIPDSGVNLGGDQGLKNIQELTPRSSAFAYQESTPRMMQEAIPKAIPTIGYKGLSDVSEKVTMTSSSGIGPIEAGILQGTRIEEKREFREQSDLGSKKIETYQYTGEYKPIFQVPKDKMEGESKFGENYEIMSQKSGQNYGEQIQKQGFSS